MTVGSTQPLTETALSGRFNPGKVSCYHPDSKLSASQVQRESFGEKRKYFSSRESGTDFLAVQYVS